MPVLRTRDAPRQVASELAFQPPPVNIVAPTPRAAAFTFPPTHNLCDSPSSSPSASPFEQALSPSSILSSSTARSLSPEFESPPTPPPSSRHRRNQPSTEDVHRPRKGDDDYIKRPENAFILFRRQCAEDREAAAAASADTNEPPKKQRQADLSKMISAKWKALNSEERHYWESLAKEKKREHAQMYPDYVYRPQRVKKGAGVKARQKVRALEREQAEERAKNAIEFSIPDPNSSSTRHHGRSVSAPNAPQYQTFSFPTMFNSNSSCPTSPLLVPLIEGQYAGGHDASASSFDYIPHPNASYAPAVYESQTHVHSMYQQPTAPLPAPLQVDQHQDYSSVMHQQMYSPASTASGPASPNSAPFTPTLHSSQPIMYASHEQQLHELQMYQQHHDTQLDIDLAGFAWDAASLWGPTDLVIADDFDINSIPPIELGIPKLFDDGLIMGGQPEYGEYAQEGMYHDENGGEGGMLGFDDIMATGSF